MAKKKKKWIPENLKEGAYTKSVKQRGLSMSEAIQKDIHSPNKKLRARAILAMVFRKIAKKRKKSK